MKNNLVTSYNYDVIILCYFPRQQMLSINILGIIAMCILNPIKKSEFTTPNTAFLTNQTIYLPFSSDTKIQNHISKHINNQYEYE